MSKNSKKPIKSFKYSDKSELKVGETVFLGDMDKTDYFKDKCSMCYAELNGIEDLQDVLIMEDSPCWGHEIEILIHQIGEKKSLRIEQWRDEWKHWRAGIEWYGENDYQFICEYPTLVECLRKIKEFMDKDE